MRFLRAILEHPLQAIGATVGVVAIVSYVYIFAQASRAAIPIFASLPDWVSWTVALATVTILIFTRQIFISEIRPRIVGWFVIWVWAWCALFPAALLFVYFSPPDPNADWLVVFHRIAIAGLAIVACAPPMLLGVIVRPSGARDPTYGPVDKFLGSLFKELRVIVQKWPEIESEAKLLTDKAFLDKLSSLVIDEALKARSEARAAAAKRERQRGMSVQDDPEGVGAQ